MATSAVTTTASGSTVYIGRLRIHVDQATGTLIGKVGLLVKSTSGNRHRTITVTASTLEGIVAEVETSIASE